MRRYLIPFTVLVGVLALASCTSSSGGGGGAGGSLAFAQPSYTVTSGSTVGMLLTLSGNTDTSGVTVSVVSAGASVAVPITAPCVLSDEAGSTASCQVEVRGLASGSATLTASAPGVASASASVSVSPAPVPGTLGFTPATTSVVAGSSQRVVLALAGSSGMSGQSVSITTSSAAVATATPTRCVLSTASPTCAVTVNGVAAGNATVQATATSYASATLGVTTTASGSITGTLAFGGNVQVGVGKTQGATLALVGSSNVSPFTATISAQNASATVSPTSCALSTAKPTCYLTITGVSAGSDRFGAAATGYAGASMVASVTQAPAPAPVPGTLHFSPGSETVSLDATTKVTLSLAGSSGVVGLSATLTSTPGASVSPGTCTLNSGSTCTIIVKGIQVGAATLTATASGYANALDTLTVQPSGTVVYGNLVITPQNLSLLPAQNSSLTVQLVGSTNVTALPVPLSASPTGIVTLGQPCTLSTANDQCTIGVTGASTGSATVSTSAVGPSSQGSAAVTVTSSASPSLSFTPNTVVLAVYTPGVGPTAITTVLTMSNPPATPITVDLGTPVDPVLFSITPTSPCVMSIAQPSCVLYINNSATTGLTGPYSITARPLDHSIQPVTLPVYISPLAPVSRTLTVVNQCPFIVYPGISGGSVYGVTPTVASDCPPGSTFFNARTAKDPIYQCMWTNPTLSSYQLAAAGPGGATVPGGTANFTIPSNSLTNVPGRFDVWSGGIMARYGCDPDGIPNGNCVYGTCNGGATGSQACAIGKGFQGPQTVAEFTLMNSGSDTYDLQVIGGVTIPTTMGPTTASRDLNEPYNNGEAGGTQQQAGITRTLFASPWVFTPPSSGGPGSSTYFNYVTGTAPLPALGDQCSDANPCGGSQVCGYASNSIMPWFDPSGTAQPPTYTRTCGARLAYLSADGIWKGNPDESTYRTNTAPFAFYSVPDTGVKSSTTPFPNSNGYPMYTFFECDAPTWSGYTANVTYPYACGCSDWTGIASPTSQCQSSGITGDYTSYTSTTPNVGFNSAWLNNVLPMITWLKHGCPTCYTFQFDDASSTFSGYSPVSNNIASNATNYTITFCPGGTTVPAH